MTLDQIKKAAMELVADLRLQPMASIAAYERIVAFGVAVADANKRRKGGRWSNEARAKLRADPVRMERMRAGAAKARQSLVAKAMAKED